MVSLKKELAFKDEKLKRYGQSIIQCLIYTKSVKLGDTVASWLVRSSLERAVRVEPLPGDILLCFWARRLAPTLPLSS